MKFQVRVDIGRLRFVLSNDAFFSGVKRYSRRTGWIALRPIKFLWCMYAKRREVKSCHGI